MKYKLVTGNALQALNDLEDESIQLTVTSPPYYMLRKYSEQNKYEIGREDSIPEYIKNLSKIFSLLKKKTKNDGLFFLNLGDTYINGQLAGIPWRVALELMDLGWILRSDIIWKNQMQCLLL